MVKPPFLRAKKQKKILSVIALKRTVIRISKTIIFCHIRCKCSR